MAARDDPVTQINHLYTKVLTMTSDLQQTMSRRTQSVTSIYFARVIIKNKIIFNKFDF